MNIRYFLTFLAIIWSFSVLAKTDAEFRIILKSLYGESEIYERFFYELKNAIAEKDAERVAELNGYPIRINFDSGPIFYNSKKEFVANYEKIVTSEMYKRVRKQEFSDLFANNYGLHIGYGDIWFIGLCISEDSANPCGEVKVYVSAYNVNFVEK